MMLAAAQSSATEAACAGVSSSGSRNMMSSRNEMGDARVYAESKRVIKIMPESNILIVKGSVPGPKGGYVIIIK